MNPADYANQHEMTRRAGTLVPALLVYRRAVEITLCCVSMVPLTIPRSVQQRGAQRLSRGEDHMSMTNPSITVPINASGVLCVLGFGLTIGDWGGWFSDGAGLVGIGLLALGHLLCMHGMFERQGRREQAAYEMGRESMRLLK